MAASPEELLVSQSVSVDVQVASSAAGLPDDEIFESWVATVLEAKAKEHPVEVCVRIVDEAEGRELNNAYRAIDKPTNVLSFPSGIEEGMAVEGPEPLGDIVICAPVVAREAAEQGKKLTDHWAHLVVHGTLHLLGYDHESDDDAEIMESIEKEILAAGGVTDPYAA